MTRSKEYVKNTAILLVGKFSTQFMSFLLIPLYTKYLVTSDYGTIDLIQTYITLFLPVFTLRMDSAAFRFLVDCRKDENETKRVISNISIVAIAMALVVLLIALVASNFVNIPGYGYLCFCLIISMISSVYLQVLRGQGKTIHYSIASIIASVSTLVLNIVFIIMLGFGAESILLSSGIANLLCLIYILVSSRLLKYLSASFIDKSIIKRFLKYSIPLIPHSLSWWIINVSDRTIINLFLGAAFNGIYTVSCKMSNILNSVFSIFGLSWQETASLHINDKDKDVFFTDMINRLLLLFANIALLILVLLPIFYGAVIGESYRASYDYIPVLLYANVWSVLTGLLGGIYIAKKRTKEIANTTIISAVINIAINLILIKAIGLHAATVSTLVSCMAMSIYRVYDCRKYVKYDFDFRGMAIFSFLFILSSYLYYMNGAITNMLNLVLVITYSIIINRKTLKILVGAIIKGKKG